MVFLLFISYCSASYTIHFVLTAFFCLLIQSSVLSSLTLSQHGVHSRLQSSLWVGAHRTPVYTLRNKESDALFPSLISELTASGEAEDLFSCHYHGLA